MNPTTAPTGVLALDGVCKRYRDSVAVEHVSFVTRPGEFLTLLGPSGSGKSTTLGMIAGFVEATSGSVTLDGADLAQLPPHKRDIGVVFQNYALFPHMTAAENVAFPLRMRGMAKAEVERRAQAALELVKLGRLGGRKPKELSGGQQQRVAFARAVVFEPRLLLMDEPLGALDKQLREALQLEVMRISRQLGVTVVYVTHDQEEALVMSDRIAVYNDGAIQQIGSAEDLYERPGSLFVADFIGESNIIRGRWDGGRGGRLVRDGLALAGDGGGGAGLTDGAPAGLVLRPERIRIARSAPADAVAVADGCSVTGVVQEIVYLGMAFKYVVKVAEGLTIHARAGVAERPRDVEAGTSVTLRWQVGDGVVLPEQVAA